MDREAADRAEIRGTRKTVDRQKQDRQVQKQQDQYEKEPLADFLGHRFSSRYMPAAQTRRTFFQMRMPAAQAAGSFSDAHSCGIPTRHHVRYR